ncbi:MAG: flagellar assembly protein FliW [Clostridiales bacterium]|nr:flagellar assembly protein FliW [Clostridiales bacterium]
MQVSTARFGTVEVDNNKVLHFADGLPGLEEHKQFVILQVSDSYPVVWMQSTGDPAICLPVIDSFLAVPEYTFNIGDEDVSELGITCSEDLHILSVLVIPENLEAMTVNLAAPIVINMESGQAKQVLLSGSEYGVRHPVFSEICRIVKEEVSNAGSVKEDK